MAFISISLIVVGLVMAACCIMPVLAWALEKEDIRRKKKKEAEEMEETNIRDRNDEDDNEIATLYDPYEKTEHTADKTRIWFCSSNERFPNDKKDKYGYKYMQIT